MSRRRKKSAGVCGKKKACDECLKEGVGGRRRRRSLFLIIRSRKRAMQVFDIYSFIIYTSYKAKKKTTTMMKKKKKWQQQQEKMYNELECTHTKFSFTQAKQAERRKKSV